jgi:hypothetical protein
MQSPEAGTAAPPSRTQLHLALAGLADEVVGTLAHLLAYVGVLALFAILGLAALDRFPDLGDEGAAPDLSRGQMDSLEKTAASDRRAAIACLQSVTSEKGPRLAKSFARAEPKRGPCDGAGSPDWLRDTANAQLRGTL